MGKHIPIRECIACRKKCEKKALLRIVKKDDVFLIDTDYNIDGRGAYMCFDCLNSPDVLKKRPLDRAFKQKVNENVYKELEKMWKEAE